MLGLVSFFNPKSRRSKRTHARSCLHHSTGRFDTAFWSWRHLRHLTRAAKSAHFRPFCNLLSSENDITVPKGSECQRHVTQNPEKTGEPRCSWRNDTKTIPTVTRRAQMSKRQVERANIKIKTYQGDGLAWAHAKSQSAVKKSPYPPG